MLAEAIVSKEALVRRWTDLARDASTPDYYELNEFGEIIMSPRPTNDHQRVIKVVLALIDEQLGPDSVSEVSVLTDRGIRVPDLVWMSAERWKSVKGKTPLPFAPDLCVEVLSPSNSPEEISMKSGAYLRAGAREVIVVGLRGQIRYFGLEGERKASSLGLNLNIDPTMF